MNRLPSNYFLEEKKEGTSKCCYKEELQKGIHGSELKMWKESLYRKPMIVVEFGIAICKYEWTTEA